MGVFWESYGWLYEFPNRLILPRRKKHVYQFSRRGFYGRLFVVVQLFSDSHCVTNELNQGLYCRYRRVILLGLRKLQNVGH